MFEASSLLGGTEHLCILQRCLPSPGLSSLQLPLGSNKVICPEKLGKCPSGSPVAFSVEAL